MPDIECPDSKGIKTCKSDLHSWPCPDIECPDSKGIKTQVPSKVVRQKLILNALIQKGLRQRDSGAMFSRTDIECPDSKGIKTLMSWTLRRGV